jgi:hypothetical protein
MDRRTRLQYTETDKALMWDRWQKGDSLHAIADHFGRYHTSISGILGKTGGIRPPIRIRSKRSLTLPEREDISRGIVAGHSVCSMALTLNRSPSTISREISRNGGRQRYRAVEADQAALDRAHRP